MTAQVIIGKILGVIKTVNYRHIISLLNRFKFSITIIPEGTSYISARRYPFWRVAFFLFVFGGVSAFVTGMMMVYTPLNKYFFSQTYQLSHYQVEDLKKLDKQIKYLAGEVDRLRENNQKLQQAIIRSDSTLLKPFLSRTAPKNGFRKIGSGGNLLDAFNFFLAAVIPAEGNESILFRKPCDGFISNRFHPSDGHFGIDYSLNVGTPVFASANAYVVFADYTADDGNMIILNHGDGYVTVYKHCLQILKKVRQRVIQGETIALSGGTGRLSSGPHLHFEVWKDGVCLDPLKILENN